MPGIQQDLIFYIVKRLETVAAQCRQQYEHTRGKIGFFVVDDLLPPEITMQINAAFPPAREMMLKKSIRQDKYVASQMDKYNPLLERAVFAFQDPKIVELIAEITGIQKMQPDANLYAGGISMMGKNQFLNPHLDNSHDKDRNLWRVLNLLFYVTPDWKENFGGNLELWPDGLQQKPVTVHGKFNRLVVMATHDDALHSVSPVTHHGFRKCVSNYYFAEAPLRDSDKFHVTSFRACPGNKLKDKMLKADTWLRMKVRKIFKKGIVENPHVYKKEK